MERNTMEKENKKDTKLCKHCKTEIPKDAKVCPNCRKKQKGIGKWITIAVVVVILIAAMSGGEDNPKKVETADAESSETTTESATDTSEDREEKDTFGIGETAEMNNVQVTMVSYSENEGSEYNKPTDGNEYVMVEFDIVNNSENEITVSSALSFDGYADDYALNYSFAAMMENETSNQLDGTIAPGKKMDGMVGFEVPKDWKTMEIHFKDDVWSNSKFKFEIEK